MKPVQTDYLPTTFSAEKLRSERVMPMAGMPTNILDEGGLRLARCDFDGVENAEAIANAARFMDCWNALAGISEPAKLRAALDELRANFHKPEFGNKDWCDTVRKLIAMLPENTDAK